MANTTVASELQVKKYLSDYFKEFVRGNRFSRYTGTGSNNVITIKEGRKKIEIPLINRLSGTGVSGSATLRGNGEALPNYGYELSPTYYRNAVEFDREEMEKPNIDLMQAARPSLMDWSMEKIRDDVIEAMGAVHNGTSYFNYGDASAAQLNSWASNNDDRVLYGATVSNFSGVHATDLAKLDANNDQLRATTVALAKRMAKNARPRIRPLKGNEEEENFIIFCDSFAFRDLKEDLVTNHQNAQVRGRTNPIWRDGDLEYDGVVIREVPEIADFIDDSFGSDWSSLATAGASSGRVTPCFMCGAQALGYGMGQRPRIVVDRLTDYEFQPGVAVELKHDIDKLFFDDNPSGTSSQHVQHGMVTIFVNAQKDI
jgi:N4-gp56 family major capsid protein